MLHVDLHVRGQKTTIPSDLPEPINYNDRQGTLSIVNFGRVIFISPNYHSEDFIWPLGFKSIRQWYSTQIAKRATLYTSEIMVGKGDPDSDPTATPLFR
jgi:hypothetical protein